MTAPDNILPFAPKEAGERVYTLGTAEATRAEAIDKEAASKRAWEYATDAADRGDIYSAWCYAAQAFVYRDEARALLDQLGESPAAAYERGKRDGAQEMQKLLREQARTYPELVVGRDWEGA